MAYLRVMEIRVARLNELPPGFETMSAAADREGFAFVGRVARRWRSGAYLDDSCATLQAAWVGGELAAIGAQSYDEYDPSPAHRRLRHFYVSPQWRRIGVGRVVAEALIEDAFALAPRLHLRATRPLSAAFWDAMGFKRVERADRTHEKVRA